MNTYKQAMERKEKERLLRNLPFRQWWLLYIGVGIIAILSSFAGAYLGLSPDANGNVYFKDVFDTIGKVLFSGFYMVMFFLTAEAAFLFWLDKLISHDVDERQKSVTIQLATSWLMMGIAVITMIVTSIAASQILAAWRKSFSGSAAFPVWTNGWILEAIPALIILHIIAATLYKQSTKEAELERFRKAKMREARINALDEGTTAYVNEFKRVAPEAARRAYMEKARNDANAMKAEIGIFDEEKKSGKDLNKDGFIGNPMERQFAQTAENPTSAGSQSQTPRENGQQRN